MSEFRYGYLMEVGSYSPRDPKFIEAKTPKGAAVIAKQLYEANPFSIMDEPPMVARKILITMEKSAHIFDYNTLEQE